MTITSCLTTDSPTFQLPLLALDIGERRIGVAVCDHLGMTCSGIACLQRNDRAWPDHLSKLIKEYGAKGIIVGLPKNMDGTEGKQAADCRAAAQQVQDATGLPVHMWDERLTTWEAKERLRNQGLNEKRVSAKLDQTAAAIILETFITAHSDINHG